MIGAPGVTPGGLRNQEVHDVTPVSALLEYVIREIASTEGGIVLEVVFSSGRYRRGYLRSGPLSIEQIETRHYETTSARRLSVEQPGAGSAA